MTIYEFKCPECELIKELQTPMSEYEKLKGTVFCPKCDTQMERVYTIPSMQFKGSGFHCTDYPKKQWWTNALEDPNKFEKIVDTVKSTKGKNSKDS